ncbi:MAG: hypothetical protein K2N23_00200 [Clostridia bacterium]|nr:hypothetical protein [Clostridia bacterium]
MISFDKKHLPKYIYKFNIALIIFFAVWFAAGVPLMVTIGCFYGESAITFAVMASSFAVFLIGFFIFWLVDNKLHKRLIEQRTAELEKEFCEMPFEEAERILKERRVITDNGFVVNDDVFGNKVIPFEETWFIFNFISLNESVNMEILVFHNYNGNSGRQVEVLHLDRELYNFFANKETDLKDDPSFNLLIKDKKEFAKQALKYSKTLRWDFSGGRHA